MAKGLVVVERHTFERAMAVARELYGHRQRGDCTLESECRRTIDSLVGAWVEGKWCWPKCVRDSAYAGQHDATSRLYVPAMEH